MNINEFERAVWEIQGIRIVVLGGLNDEVEDYDLKRAARQTWTLGELIEKHIRPRVGNRAVVVLDTNGQPVALQTQLQNMEVHVHEEEC